MISFNQFFIESSELFLPKYMGCYDVTSFIASYDVTDTYRGYYVAGTKWNKEKDYFEPLPWKAGDIVMWRMAGHGKMAGCKEYGILQKPTHPISINSRTEYPIKKISEEQFISLVKVKDKGDQGTTLKLTDI